MHYLHTAIDNEGRKERWKRKQGALSTKYEVALYYSQKVERRRPLFNSEEEIAQK
jgi:hypothetical protein